MRNSVGSTFNSCPYRNGEPVWYNLASGNRLSPNWIPGRVVNINWMTTLGRIQRGDEVEKHLKSALVRCEIGNRLLLESLDDFNFLVCNWRRSIKPWKYEEINTSPPKKNRRGNLLNLAILRANKLFELARLCSQADLPVENMSNAFMRIMHSEGGENILTQIHNLLQCNVEDIISNRSTYFELWRHDYEKKTVIRPQLFPRLSSSNQFCLDTSILQCKWMKLAITLMSRSSEIVSFLELLPQDIIYNSQYSLCSRTPKYPISEEFLKNILYSHTPLHALYLDVCALLLHKISQTCGFLSWIPRRKSSWRNGQPNAIKSSLPESIFQYSFSKESCNSFNLLKTENMAALKTSERSDGIQGSLPEYFSEIEKPRKSSSPSELSSRVMDLMEGEIKLCFMVGFVHGRGERYISWDSLPYMGLEYGPPYEFRNSELSKFSGIENNVKTDRSIKSLHRDWYAPEEQCRNIEILFVEKSPQIRRVSLRGILEVSEPDIEVICRAYFDVASQFDIAELERRLVAKGKLFCIREVLKPISAEFVSGQLLVDATQYKVLEEKLLNIKKSLMSIQTNESVCTGVHPF